MFNGQGRIERLGSNAYRASLDLPGTNHTYEVIEGSPEAAKGRLDFIASFFSDHDLLHPKAMEAAKVLRAEYLNPATRPSADRKIDLLFSKMHESGVCADVLYALRKLAAQDRNSILVSGDDAIIGWRIRIKKPSFKKFTKAVSKAVKVVKKVAPVAFPAVALSKVTANVAKKVVRSPNFIRNVGRVAFLPFTASKLAVDALQKGVPSALNTVSALAAMATGQTAPADATSIEEAQAGQDAAAEALANVQAAAEQQGIATEPVYQQLPEAIQQQLPPAYQPPVYAEEALDPYGYPEPYGYPDPYGYSDSYQEPYMYEESDMMYGDGEELEDEIHDYEEIEEVEIAGLGSFIKKAAGTIRRIAPALDPSRKGSLAASAVGMIPGVGPQIQNAANLVAQAKAGSKDAIDKLKDVRDLASAGIPAAQEAQANIDTAKKIGDSIRADEGRGRNIGGKVKLPWFPFRDLRHLGAVGKAGGLSSSMEKLAV